MIRWKMTPTYHTLLGQSLRDAVRWAPIAIALILGGCGEKAANTDMPPERVVDLPDINEGTASMQDTLIPTPDGGKDELLADDFVGGRYGEDILVSPASTGVDVKAEEENAKKSGVFVGSPGFIWKISPVQPVKITLSSRLGSQSIQRQPDELTGVLAVSLAAFNDIFPPTFREVYELVLSSEAGSLSPFRVTYRFALKRKDPTSALSSATSILQRGGLILGKGGQVVELGEVKALEGCDICTVSLSEVEVTAVKKTFVELPAIPQNTKYRISNPSRFSGLLVKRTKHALVGKVEAQNLGRSALLRVTVPADITTTTPWCTIGPRGAAGSAPCPIQVNELSPPINTYFGSINAIPKKPEINLLGSVEGVAWFRITAKAKLKIEREGVIIEKRDVYFDSGDISPLDDPSIPTWALDDFRSALYSGAPELAY